MSSEYKYHRQSPEEFRQTVAAAGISLQPSIAQTILSPNGIYVSPETKNTYSEYSCGEIEGCRYEQFVTEYLQDLALAARAFALVFAIELPRPTAPVYIASQTTLTLNSILRFQSVPILKGIEKVTLEGDFSEFFSVYSRDQHALDAWTTVVPNLMVDMLANGDQLDIEFADNYIYFYRIYTASYSSHGEKQVTSIGLSAQDYIAMRDFATKYATAFVRAARGSTGPVENMKPLWQIVNDNQAANNARQFLWLIGILIYLGLLVFLWFIVIPLSLLWFGIRLLQWHNRKKRLISHWTGRI